MKKQFLLVAAFLLFITNIVSAQTVYVTNTGTKYHVSSCHYLSKSKIAIELTDAVNKGYTPCSICKPSSGGYTTPTYTQPQSPTYNTPQTTTQSVQCSAITKEGNRCLRMTTSPNGKCWQHGGK